jgi:hypothetical protein
MIEAIREIALTDIAGLPLVVWLGLLTLLSLLSTATYGYLLFKGRIRGTITRHMTLAFATVVIALVHATFALSLYI